MEPVLVSLNNQLLIIPSMSLPTASLSVLSPCHLLDARAIRGSSPGPESLFPGPIPSPSWPLLIYLITAIKSSLSIRKF